MPKQLTHGILNENNLSIWLGNRWRQIELNILNTYFRQPFSTGKNRFQGWSFHFANLSHIPNVIRHGIEKVNGLRKNDSIVIERNRETLNTVSACYCLCGKALMKDVTEMDCSANETPLKWKCIWRGEKWSRCMEELPKYFAREGKKNVDSSLANAHYVEWQFQ